LSLRFEELGYEITPAELEAAYANFTNLADRKKRVYDQDLISLLSANAKTREDKSSVGCSSLVLNRAL
jgi:isopropylmalate/homocitrate/citramalate synthase